MTRCILKFSIYRAMRMHRADYDVARCSSVCPSDCHTPQYCIEMAKHIVELFLPSNSHTTAILQRTPHKRASNAGVMKQELSYRKQIARQLCTQYVEGIYDNPVTVKSRLRVTQGHWKQNH